MLYSTAMPLKDFQESEVWQFHRDTMDLQESRGRNMRPGPILEKWIREKGFINVQVQKFRLPLGPWDNDKLEVKLNYNLHREYGRLTQQNYQRRVGLKNLYQMLEDISGLGMTLIWGGKATREEVEMRLVQVRKDLWNFNKFKAQYD
jgi:hypothetical protein